MITFNEIWNKFRIGTIYYEADWGKCQEMRIIEKPIFHKKKDISEIDTVSWITTIDGKEIVRNKVTELDKPYGLFWERKPDRVPPY